MADGRPLVRVACVGEVMLELVDGHARLGVAGDTFNTAAYLKRLMPGVDVAYVTLLGRDAWSDLVIKTLSEEGLDVSLIGRHDSRAAGFHAVSVDQRGERSFTYGRSQSAAKDLFGQRGPVALDQLSAFDLVYLSGITLAILDGDTRDRLFEWVANYRAAGGLIAFDSNYRPALWQNAGAARNAIARMWSLCDIALASAPDEMELFGDRSEASVIERIVSAGSTAGCLKRGELGPKSFDGTTPSFNPVPSVNVVDTTAAGDSFNAGFLAAYVAGQDIEGCMLTGHLVASAVIRHPGAIMPKEAMPRLPA